MNYAAGDKSGSVGIKGMTDLEDVGRSWMCGPHIHTCTPMHVCVCARVRIHICTNFFFKLLTDVHVGAHRDPTVCNGEGLRSEERQAAVWVWFFFNILTRNPENS